MPPPVLLETARLRLRPPQATDLEAYASYWREPAVVRFIGGAPLSREEAWARLLRQAGLWSLFGFGFFMVEDRATGVLAGSVGFQELCRSLEPSIEGSLEAGWGLRPEWQGQGYAREALEAALAWSAVAFPERHYSCIIDPDNRASLRLAARLGFAETARAAYHGGVVVILRKGAAGAPPVAG